MRTIRIKLYKFAELSETAKQKAIDSVRGEGVDTSYIYDDAYQTVKKFHEIFGTKEGRHSWLDVQTSHLDDNLLNLKGLRLRTYIVNNFLPYLESGHYYRSWSSDKKLFHKKVSSNQRKDREGNVYFWNVYKGLAKEHSCELTGVCYDESLLQPLYEFIDWKLRPDYNSYMDFETLMNDCFDNLRKDVESEAEAVNEDEAIIETIEANDYEFTQDGKLN